MSHQPKASSKVATVEEAVKSVISQIVDAKPDFSNLVLIGILPQGEPLAARIAKLLKQETGHTVPSGTLDVTLYRDDLPTRHEYVTLEDTKIPVSLKNKHVILIQDIMRGGVRGRAALNALLDYERPKTIELATIYDIGLRFLPIIAQYCGEVLPKDTHYDARLRLFEIDGEDALVLS